MRIFSVICLFLLGSEFAHAQTFGPGSSDNIPTIISNTVKSTALTIYPDDLTLVKETRRIDLPIGVVDIQFFGVTDMIIPQSAVLEQFEGLRLEGNFDSDLITPAKLLTQSVGESLTIRRLNPVTGASDFVAAELLSAAPIDGPGRGGINAVFSTIDGIEGFQCSGLAESILLSKRPEGLHPVPVLSTRIRSDSSGPKDIVLTYLTRGIEWSADYRMDVAPMKDKQEGSLLGWLTLENKTSKSFDDTQLSFVAGALNQVKSERQSNTSSEWDRIATCVLLKHGPFARDSVVVQDASAPLSGVSYFSGGGGDGDDVVIVTGTRLANVREATQEDFGDYKLYRAPQAVSVNAHQTKQIAFLLKDKVEFDTAYSWTLSELEEDEDIEELIKDERPIHSRLTYEIDNDKAGALAVPLPRGTLRAMSRTKDGFDVFLGEGKLSNAPVGETADVKIADSFLVTARFYEIEEKEGGNISAKVELKNASDKAVETEFNFDLLEDVSVRRHDSRKKRADEDRVYSFKIPAEGTIRFSFKGKLD